MQGVVTLHVAGVGFASVANEDDVSVVSMVAVVANPVQVFLNISLVLELPLLHSVLLPLEPVVMHICPTVGTFIGIGNPPQQALAAEVMLAFQLTPIGDLVQTDCTLVLL